MWNFVLVNQAVLKPRWLEVTLYSQGNLHLSGVSLYHAPLLFSFDRVSWSSSLNCPKDGLQVCSAIYLFSFLIKFCFSAVGDNFSCLANKSSWVSSPQHIIQTRRQIVISCFGSRRQRVRSSRSPSTTQLVWDQPGLETLPQKLLL